MAKEHYAVIGAQLRDARFKHRLELSDIARHVHIRVQYLSALEEGAPEALPGLAYAKGYLHRYAQFLQLDADALAQEFENAGHFPQKRLFQFPEALAQEREPNNRLVYGSLAGAALLLVVWLVFRPVAPSVEAFIPLPIPPEVMERVPEPCRADLAPGYPACYRPAGTLWYRMPHGGHAAPKEYLRRDYFRRLKTD